MEQVATFFSFFFCFVCALLGMAFYTLFERKFLGHAQLRKGPNKVGVAGLPQPFSDAMKLFLKQCNVPLQSNSMGFLFAPMLGLFLSLVMWTLYPFIYTPYFYLYGGLVFLAISSLGVYSIIMGGWCSNSKYALLGSMRSVAQSISYEISMSIFFLCVIVLISGFSFVTFCCVGKMWTLGLLFPVFLLWFVTILAETNRAPFDFAEGESELVSGFNVEYASGSFAYIFMAEYSNILIMSVLTSFMFFPCGDLGAVAPLLSVISSGVVAIAVVWARAALPRMRYDRLMMMTWKSFLPFSLGLLFFSYSVMSFAGQ